LRSWFKNCCFVVLGLVGFKSTNAEAAVDMFLCINGVAGNPANNESDTDCIDILAWSWGASNSGQAGSGGGNSNFQDVSLTKYMDNSSAYLLKKVADGKQIPDFQLRVRQACGVPDCTGNMLYQMTVPTGSLVSSLSTGGSGGESRLTENISINLPFVEWCYADLDAMGEPTGSLSCDSWSIVSPP